MSKPNDGGPAFPVNVSALVSKSYLESAGLTGMSLRAWLAGMALNGQLSVNDHNLSDKDVSKMFAQQSVCMADALIAELEKEVKP